MRSKKDILVEIISRKAQQKVAHLAGEFARATSADKEDLLLEIQFNRWLVDCCEICLD